VVTKSIPASDGQVVNIRDGHNDLVNPITNNFCLDFVTSSVDVIHR